jgi:peptidoglycan/LPS O-acetylase OafA/YrhL
MNEGPNLVPDSVSGFAASATRGASPRTWVYRPEFDGLRALAMAAVVAFHYEHRVKGGYLGVTVFFVLSGYLITGLLRAEFEDHHRIDLPAFYARRALRLFPALVVVVVAVLVVGSITGHHEVSNSGFYEGVGASLLYVNDFALAAGHSSVWLAPTWSLGVEEQFYLLWPVLLILALRTLPVAIIGRGCVLLALLAGLLDAALRPKLGFSWTTFSPLGSIMPLLLGCGLAFVQPRLPRWLAACAGLVLAAAVFAAPNGESVTAWRGAQQLTAIAAVIVIGYMATSAVRFMRAPVLLWFGRRSYGIYLIHMAVLQALLNGVTGIPRAMHNLIGIPLTIVLAALLYRYVEQPFLRRKTRYSRAPGGTRAEEAAADHPRATLIGGEAPATDIA